jgi:hypothetical protein
MIMSGACASGLGTPSPRAARSSTVHLALELLGQLHLDAVRSARFAGIISRKDMT